MFFRDPACVSILCVRVFDVVGLVVALRKASDVPFTYIDLRVMGAVLTNSATARQSAM